MAVVELSIYRKYIKLEVETETRKAAFFQVNDNLQEERNEAQIGNEFSDDMYFDRSCQQGVDDLLDVLHKFVSGYTGFDGESHSPSDTDGDNQILDTPGTSDECWIIDLEFDGRRNIIAQSLASMCHKFVAYSMLYRWSVMTMPQLTNEYKSQLDKTKLDIQRIVYRKEPPTLSSTTTA